MINGCNIYRRNIESFQNAGASSIGIAHNATGFESLIQLRSSWIDTMAQCQQHGLPGGLNEAARRLGLGEKKDNKMLFKMFRPGVVGTVPMWMQLIRYCIQDVELTKRLHETLPPCQEQNIIDIDREINHRGVWVNKDRLHQILKWYEEHDAEVRKSLKDINLSESEAWSTQQILNWLWDKCGVSLNSVNRSMVSEFLKNPEEFADGENPDIQRAIAALDYRRQLVRVGPSKLARLFDMLTNDNRFKGSMAYYGGHTGRWSGRGMQPQNLPKPPKDFNWDACTDYAAIKREAERLNVKPADVLGYLIRTVFQAEKGKFQIADFGQIEARIVFWLAGEIWRNGLYEEMGEIVGADRQMGKVIILACGFGMGPHRFAAQSGVDFEFARKCVNAFRKKFAKIPILWRNLHNYGLNCLDKDQSGYGIRLSYDGVGLRLMLPSGRYLYYRNPRIEQRVAKWRALYGAPAELEPTFCYDHRRGYVAEMYGGKWVENVAQAIARDCLVEKVLKPFHDSAVLHIHDAGILENGGLTELKDSMESLIAWAPGLKLSAEGYEHEEYRK
jgi:DNA polymerase